MSRLSQGSIVRIPLLKELGYAYAKYLDISKIDPQVSLAYFIKVFDLRTIHAADSIDDLELKNFLIAPMAVAGLWPELRSGNWKIVGKLKLDERDYILPDLKGGNSSYEEINTGRWTLYKGAKLGCTFPATFEELKYLQTFAAIGTGNIEVLLSMYFLQKENKSVAEYFDLNDENFKWNYVMIQGNLLLPR